MENVYKFGFIAIVMLFSVCQSEFISFRDGLSCQYIKTETSYVHFRVTRKENQCPYRSEHCRIKLHGSAERECEMRLSYNEGRIQKNGSWYKYSDNYMVVRGDYEYIGAYYVIRCEDQPWDPCYENTEFLRPPLRVDLSYSNPNGISIQVTTHLADELFHTVVECTGVTTSYTCTNRITCDHADIPEAALKDKQKIIWTFKRRCNGTVPFGDKYRLTFYTHDARRNRSSNRFWQSRFISRYIKPRPVEKVSFKMIDQGLPIKENSPTTLNVTVDFAEDSFQQKVSIGCVSIITNEDGRKAAMTYRLPKYSIANYPDLSFVYTFKVINGHTYRCYAQVHALGHPQVISSDKVYAPTLIYSDAVVIKDLSLKLNNDSFAVTWLTDGEPFNSSFVISVCLRQPICVKQLVYLELNLPPQQSNFNTHVLLGPHHTSGNFQLELGIVSKTTISSMKTLNFTIDPPEVTKVMVKIRCTYQGHQILYKWHTNRLGDHFIIGMCTSNGSCFENLEVKGCSPFTAGEYCHATDLTSPLAPDVYEVTVRASENHQTGVAGSTRVSVAPHECLAPQPRLNSIRHVGDSDVPYYIEEEVDYQISCLNSVGWYNVTCKNGRWVYNGTICESDREKVSPNRSALLTIIAVLGVVSLVAIAATALIHVKKRKRNVQVASLEKTQT